MPRTARLQCPGGVFHVVSRFARDEWVMDREGARGAYLGLLGKAAATAGVQVLGYCLMSNHVHLVVVQGDSPLERFTKSLHTGFASWVRAHGRRRNAQGPVFAGRPRMVLVERDGHLLELLRYVHNNPVRAGVARFARSSDWSSHQAYIGRVAAPEWLRVGFVLAQLGRDAAAFDELVNQGRREPRRPELSGAADAGEAARVRRAMGDGYRVSDGLLGSADFVARMKSDDADVEAALSSRGTERRAGALRRPSARAVVDAALELLGVDAIDLAERPRSRSATQVKRLAIWAWVHEYQGQQIEMARVLGLDTSVVSRYYGQAMRAPGDYDELATGLVAIAERARRTRPRTEAEARRLRVRYHVDVDEG